MGSPDWRTKKATGATPDWKVKNAEKSQAEKDLAILIEAETIKKDAERFKAARALPNAKNLT